MQNIDKHARGVASAAGIGGSGMNGKIARLPTYARNSAAVLLLALAAWVLLAGCSSVDANKIDGLSAQQWAKKGNDLWANGRYTRTWEAIDYFNKAIELDPDFRQAYISRGIAYDNLKRYSGALRDFGEAISLDPNDKSAYNNRGITLRKTGELKDALADFDRAIEIDPEYKSAFNNRGNLHRAMGNHALAIKDYDRALEINPDYARALANRSESYFAMEDKTRACQDKRRACALGYRQGCRSAERKC